MTNCPISFGLVTAQLAECRDFYVRHFGLQVTSDLGWYIHLRSADGSFNFGLLAPERSEVQAPFQLPLISPANGFYLGIEVDDVEQKLGELVAAGIEPLAPLRDEPWGERHFLIRDPAGCLLNVWQRIAKA